MNEEPGNTRIELIRNATVFQLKLLADGLRDAVLIPISLVAALIGVIRGGDEPDREFRRVLKLGLLSERWINLFGHQKPLGRPHPTGSLDTLLEQVESVVMDQYKKGRATEETREAIDEAFETARREAELRGEDSAQ